MKQTLIALTVVLLTGVIFNNTYAQSNDSSKINKNVVDYLTNGLGVVEHNGKYGLIDKNGKEVAPVKYDDINGFYEDDGGFGTVELNGKYGLIDKTGKEVTPIKYHEVGSFYEGYGGLGIVKLNRKYGFIDKTGNEVTPIKYDDIGNFNEGFNELARVVFNGKHGLIDKSGKEVLPPKYDDIEHYFDEKAELIKVELHGKYGFINKSGKEIIPPTYDYVVEGFSDDGLAEVELNGKLISIDKNGNIQYDKETLKTMKKLNADSIVSDPGNGDGAFKARHKKTKKWGMYQFENEMIPMQYDSLQFFPFNGNFTAVYNGGKVGIYLCEWSFNDKAKQTVSCEYENYKRISVERDTEWGTEQFTYLAMQKNSLWGWVDWLSGEEKSSFTYKTIKELPYPNYKQDKWFED
jgi:hypothetical protein